MLLPASHVGHAMDMCCITAQCLRKSAADRALLGPTWVTQHTCTVSSGGRPDLRHDLCCSVARVSHHFFTHASYTSSLQAQTEQERLRSEHYKEMADACLAGNWAMQLQPQGPRQGSPVPEPSSGAVAKASSKRSRSRSQKKPHDRRSSKHRDGRERSRSRHRLNYQDRSSSKYGDRRSAAGAGISSGPKTGAAQSMETGQGAAGAGTGKSPKTGATQSMETAGGAADTRCAGMWQRHTALGMGAAGTGGTLTKPKAGLNQNMVEGTP